MKAILSVLLLVILFILALAVGAQNEQLVKVNYLIAESQWRLSWVMAGLFLLGFLTCFAFLSAFYAKHHLAMRALRRRSLKQQQQLLKLQNQLSKE